jgi:hypothetical protein
VSAVGKWRADAERAKKKAKPKPLHGLIEDMPEGEYHAHRGSLSHSGAKTILKAPALFQWEREHPVHKDVFDFGSAAHALVLGQPIEELVYVAPFDDWTRRKGPEGGTQYTTDEKRIAQADGLAPILPKDWLVVCDMAEALAKHRLASQLLSEGKAEVSAFCPDERTGVLRRARFDHLGPAIVTDYKTADCADPWVWVRRNAYPHGYFQQQPWYLDLLRDLGYGVQAFAFIVQEKNPPYLVEVIELDAEAEALGRARNRRALEIYRDCTEAGVWPGYSPDDTYTTVSLPGYAFRDDEQDIA